MKQAQQRLLGKPKPREIPLLDKELAKRAGKLTKFDKFKAQKTLVFIRHAVNTRAFEHLVAGLVNTKSSWYAAVHKPSTHPSSFRQRLKGLLP